MARKKQPNEVENEVKNEVVAPPKKKGQARGICKALAGDLGQDPGDNTKIVLTNLKFFDMPKVDLKNPEEVQSRLAEYFQIYGEADLKPTVSGMAMALGVDRRRLWAIANDQPNGGNGFKLNVPAETTDLIKKAYQILENSMENYAASGKINPVMAIFMMKNHFNYQDKVEHVLTPNTNQSSDYNVEDITKRYLPDSIDHSDSGDSDSDSE